MQKKFQPIQLAFLIFSDLTIMDNAQVCGFWWETRYNGWGVWTSSPIIITFEPQTEKTWSAEQSWALEARSRKILTSLFRSFASPNSDHPTTQWAKNTPFTLINIVDKYRCKWIMVWIVWFEFLSIFCSFTFLPIFMDFRDFLDFRDFVDFWDFSNTMDFINFVH